jgi:protein-S-isoprenylcysteine O-methyltransferase Ste14
MIMCDPLSKEDGSRVAPRTGDRLNRGLARAGRLLFTHRLEIGLGVTAVIAPFVKPTLAKTPAQRSLKAGGFFLVLIGLALRVWASLFAGRHTRSRQIEGDKLAAEGPYGYVRNPIYLGSVVLGSGMVLLIGDRRLVIPSALTFLALYFGLIPAEEEFLTKKFPEEYAAYCRNVSRLIPRLTPWSGAAKKPFDWRAASGEWRLVLILAGILALFRTVAGLRSPKRAK